MMRTMLFLCLLLLPAAAQAQVTTMDENRVGPVARDTSEVVLQGQVGEQMRRVVFEAGNGQYRCATAIYPESSREAIVTWRDDNDLRYRDDSVISQKDCQQQPPFNVVNSVIVRGTDWRMDGDIGPGAKVSALLAVNRMPITFRVCQCEEAGKVLSWNSGSMPANISARLKYADNQPFGRELNSVTRDGAVSTRDMFDGHLKQVVIERLGVHFYPD